jgi:hypothetical protein
MYQEYKIPFKFDAHKDISFSVDKEEDFFIYRRECLDEKLEKTLAINKGEIIINPIEPLTKPKELTPYFMIKLDQGLIIEPKETKILFLTFPIEIGVFISSRQGFNHLDSFSLAKHKYTLYGDPRQGLICKYWKSNIYPEVPVTDPFQEGIMELKVSNDRSNWVEITQAVFNAYGMKIYYDDQKVAMKAQMRVEGVSLAETEFIDSPLESGMKKSLESFMARKLTIGTEKSVMELGL